MSLNHSKLANLDAFLILLVGGALMIRYAFPQLIYSLYPLLELARVIWPQFLASSLAG